VHLTHLWLWAFFLIQCGVPYTLANREKTRPSTVSTGTQELWFTINECILACTLVSWAKHAPISFAPRKSSVQICTWYLLTIPKSRHYLSRKQPRISNFG
jgi:hypothetical protein